eukprot:m.325194 g.325194  ORF g.325194 m.325194 type:complete len:309 (-) comp37695_c0_seq1:62-988(-)
MPRTLHSFVQRKLEAARHPDRVPGLPWACAVCTLHNPPERTACQVCLTKHAAAVPPTKVSQEPVVVLDDEEAPDRAHDVSGRECSRAKRAAPAPAPEPAAAQMVLQPVLSCPKSVPHRAVRAIGGLYIFDDFISCAEENMLLDNLRQQEKFHISHWNGVNLGTSWGVKTDFRLRTVTAGDRPLPAYLDFVLARMRSGSFPPLRAFRPNEANCIQYIVARQHHLAPHFDDRKLSGELLANLSLASECHMTYVHGKSGRKIRVLLPRRSLQVVTGEARYDWQHGILNEDIVGPVRVSITFRHTDTTGKVA